MFYENKGKTRCYFTLRPASGLEFPLSTNFEANSLAEDTYATSKTGIHRISRLRNLIEHKVEKTHKGHNDCQE